MNATFVLASPVRARTSFGSGLSRIAMRVAALALTVVIAACGGGASTEENPVVSTPPVANYTGPAPASADVQAFKLNVWDTLKASNRCGSCHGTGGQMPNFVRSDDINLAYQQAMTVIDLVQPGNSRMVEKVGGGHNCWLSADSACADTLTAMIRNMAGASAGGSSTIQLQPPPLKDAGGSRSFPDSAGLFATTVHPLLKQYCARCHVSTAVTPQSPFFASTDASVAYAAVKEKINLDDPASSRLVVRLRDEFHNCWDNCSENAAEMLAAIRDFANQVPVTQVDPDFVISKALGLYDGTVASGGNRYDNNLIALYEFKTGTGTVAYDTSGVEPALNLTMSGDVSWVGGWGVNVKQGKLQGTTAGSKKLHDLILATGEYSIEAWVAPANVVQQDSYIVSYSGGTAVRNVTLAQDEYNYQALGRSSTTDANGMPFVATPAAARVLQATLQHVVLTYDPINGRRLYVNGQLVNVADPAGGGLLSDWDDTFALVLGNEVSSTRKWAGVLRLVAIHNRALTGEQITKNFEAGVGERFYLLFNVEQLIGVPQSYVMFEVSQFDSYSYLFNKPALISLDTAARPNGIQVKGMRIGVNGAEAKVGQAYVPLDVTTATDGSYDPAQGVKLSDIGTVVALEKGPAYDQFFLTFEKLGTHTNARTEPTPLSPAAPADKPRPSDVGLRVMDEINATMAQVTTVSPQETNVKATFERVRQQLPTVENIEGFLAAHQVGVAQLAIEYCNSLVENTTLRAAYFPGFNFGAAPATAFGSPANRNLVINPLLDKVLGVNLTSQPDSAQVRTEVNSLMDRLTSCGGSCPADRTEVTVKASCAAILGSAGMLIQ